MIKADVIFPLQNEHDKNSSIVELKNGYLLIALFLRSRER
jgi:hypothetical protein